MKFSLLCPSRQRPYHIGRLYKNLTETIGQVKEVELLLKVDDDDRFPHIEGSWIRVFRGARSEFLQRDYYNFLAEKAYGNYLWAIGDDIVFQTKNWDKHLEKKIEDLLKNIPDRIAYIYVDETDSQAKHPCFPLITKEAFKALGMYFHPELMSWGADRTLFEVYSGINRVFHVPGVAIKHLSYHDGSGVYDDTAKNMKERFFRNPDCHNEVSRDVVPKQIDYLKKVINESTNR